APRTAASSTRKTVGSSWAFAWPETLERLVAYKRRPRFRESRREECGPRDERTELNGRDPLQSRHSFCSRPSNQEESRMSSQPAEIAFANDVAPGVAEEAEDILAGLTAP